MILGVTSGYTNPTPDYLITKFPYFFLFFTHVLSLYAAKETFRIRRFGRSCLG